MLGAGAALALLLVALSVNAQTRFVRLGTAPAGARGKGAEGTVAVVDEQGKPVAGAQVSCWDYGRDDSRESAATLTTDEKGEAKVSLGDPSRAVLVVVTKPGFGTAWVQAVRGAQKQKLVLTAPAIISGRVLDENGKAVAGAKVFASRALYQSPSGGGGYLYGQNAGELIKAETDAQGLFRIEGLSSSVQANLTVTAPGKALRRSETSEDWNRFDWRAGDTNAVLTLVPAGVVEGKIMTEPATSPVPVAQLTLASSSGISYQSEKVESSPDGSFCLVDVPAGSFKLHARFGTNSFPDWVAPAVPVSVESGQTTKGVEIKASRGGVLKVTVVDQAAKKPIAKANVSAYREQYGNTVQTSEDGVAFLRLALEGEYNISAGSGFGQAESTTASVEAGKTNVVELEIPGPKTVKGVVRLQDGKPAAGIAIRLVGTHGIGDSSVESDAEGRFEFELPQMNSGGVDSTPCVLVRDVEHGLAAAEDLDESTESVELKLAPALTIAGNVEAEGKPLTNATADLIFWTGRSGMHLTELDRKTDKPGAFEIPALPPGRKYGILVKADGYGQRSIYDVNAGDEPKTVTIDPVELALANLKLGGQVVDSDDKPYAGASVSISGEGQPYKNTQSDKDGKFMFENVCAGMVRVYANAGGSYGSTQVEGGDTNVTLRLGQTERYTQSSKQHRLSGTVKGADGNPVPEAQVAVVPGSQIRWVKADAKGAFNLTWSLEPWQSSGGAWLAARDASRKFAAIESLSEEATNLDIVLQPALVISGKVTGEKDEPLESAEVGFWIHAGNSAQSLDEKVIKTDAKGLYTIEGLPSGGRYTVYASSKGRGRSQQEVREAETNHVEIEPLVLKVADKIIVGQVVRDTDKPVSGANVHISGEGQPQVNLTTDSKGRFKANVCEGRVQLFANASTGGYAQGFAEAGDTNVVLQILDPGSSQRSVSRRTSLRGKPLPDLTALELDADAATADKPVLLCLFDVEQRSSRRFVQLLQEKLDVLKERGVTVLGAQAASIDAATLKEWKDANPLPFAVGYVGQKPEKARWASELDSLPWMILTDAQHQVLAEGFPLDELETKIKAVTK
jgi:hypothetical protein